jgi:hypothetical protein
MKAKQTQPPAPPARRPAKQPQPGAAPYPELIPPPQQELL